MKDTTTNPSGPRDGEVSVLQTIARMAQAERSLRSQLGQGAGAADTLEELRSIEAALDQCWDLLRRRQALRLNGGDAADAHARPVAQVESYWQ